MQAPPFFLSLSPFSISLSLYFSPSLFLSLAPSLSFSIPLSPLSPLCASYQPVLQLSSPQLLPLSTCPSGPCGLCSLVPPPSGWLSFCVPCLFAWAWMPQPRDWPQRTGLWCQLHLPTVDMILAPKYTPSMIFGRPQHMMGKLRQQGKSRGEKAESWAHVHST